MLLTVRSDFGDQQRGLRARIVGLFLDGRDDVVRRDGLPPVERGAQQVLTRGEVPVERALRRLEASRKWLYGNTPGALVQQRLDSGVDPVVLAQSGVRHRHTLAYGRAPYASVRRRWFVCCIRHRPATGLGVDDDRRDPAR